MSESYTANLLPKEIVSPVHLAELRTMRDILPALLVTFRVDVSQSIERMGLAIETSSAEALAREAHGIAGAAGSLGGQRLAVLCRKLEEMGRAGTINEAKSLLPIVDVEYGKLCAALEALTK